ncbi:uncharacterized protein MAM_08066 [Metarhizium album ARSEF 1941]|uniref:COP9 signalosome complex subunit 6 n=1 Tax=Metarhizium album (strain ARSEF 1941) TaxID=1081103 RepID=A0A0B2WKP7_METAS|nr:uncharacterized protein MAM_08066 [Metarhizium album ARSEF 1941]KHN94057.1 hypothetical protein MAM_08066 [Metarhizium album ARSEF 1941]
MEARSSNPLLSSHKSSQVQAVLHPLVLLTISDYITRHTLRQQKGPVVGALLGQQNGREITIEHAFDCHMREAPDVQGGYLLDASKFGARLEQSWYTLLPLTGPTPVILPIQSQILQGWNESAVLLGFHPEEVLNHSVGGKLPLTIYESNYEVDDQKTADQDGADKKMEDGDATLKLKFTEVPYSVETDETEMISMNYVAAGGANATAASAPTSAAAKDDKQGWCIEATSKGKRRLVEPEGYETDTLDETGISHLTREEEEMVASLTAKANAIKMLHSRVRLLTTYLERLPSCPVTGLPTCTDTLESDYTTPSLPILRQIQALVNRFDLVIPSNNEAFDREMLQETNNAKLIDLLSSIMQGVHGVRDVNKKFHIIESAKTAGRRGMTEGYLASPGFNMPGAGDLLI